MSWRNRQVVVTGAGGFIGSHLAERLVELGARVRGLVRYNSRNEWGLLELLVDPVKNEIEVVLGDLTDPHSTTRMARARRSSFIRMGSLSPVRDLNFVSDTVAGFLKVAEGHQAVGEVINVTEEIASRLVTLPFYPSLTRGQMDTVVAASAAGGWIGESREA